MNTPPFDNAVPQMEPKPLLYGGPMTDEQRERFTSTYMHFIGKHFAKEKELARARWWASGWIAACDRDTEPDGSVLLSSKMAKCEFRMLKSAKRLLAATYPNP